MCVSVNNCAHGLEGLAGGVEKSSARWARFGLFVLFLCYRRVVP